MTLFFLFSFPVEIPCPLQPPPRPLWCCWDCSRRQRKKITCGNQHFLLRRREKLRGNARTLHGPARGFHCNQSMSQSLTCRRWRECCGSILVCSLSLPKDSDTLLPWKSAASISGGGTTPIPCLMALFVQLQIAHTVKMAYCLLSDINIIDWAHVILGNVFKK